ncbi:unnamed protein product [Lathyrus oleraceus]
MAIGINRVHFFIALLCFASVLTPGETAGSWIYCIGQGPCPNKDEDCNNYCLTNKFPKGGKCIASQCCCDG